MWIKINLCAEVNDFNFFFILHLNTSGLRFSNHYRRMNGDFYNSEKKTVFQNTEWSSENISKETVSRTVMDFSAWKYVEWIRYPDLVIAKVEKIPK